MRVCGSLLLAAALLASGTSLRSAAAQAPDGPIPVTVTSTPIASFGSGGEGAASNRYGQLDFIGGIEMAGSDALFGAWSSLRILDGGARFIGVLDTGHWLTGRLERDDAGRLAGLQDVVITPMRDRSGRLPQGKSSMDAESLAIRGDQVLVGFEQRHRIDIYPATDFTQSAPVGSLTLPFPTRELRGNGGLETVAVAPPASPLAGSVVTVAERSVDDEGRLYAGIVDGPMKGAFRVERRDDFDVTDGAFLPDGDLLLLERRFTLATGVGMRIRRIAGQDIRPGAVVDGEVILKANLAQEIDNMEGLEVYRAEDGSERIVVVSDDNHSILQRNLMLEFRLAD